MRRRAVLLGSLAALTLTGLAVRRKAGAKRFGAEAKFPPIGTIIQVKGVDVHYTRQGQGNPVILLHGAGGNLKDFTLGLADKMAKTNEVFAFDRPGHGYTDLQNRFGASPYVQAELLHAASLKLGIKSPLICGYSLGGSVALAWALNQPDYVAQLLLMATPSNPWRPEPRLLYRAAANPVTGAVVTPLIAAFAPEGLVKDTLKAVFRPQDIPPDYSNRLGAALSMRAATLRANTRQIIGLRRNIIEMSTRYQELTLPMELIHGSADTVVSPVIHSDILAKTLPHAKYTRIEGMGHGVQFYAQNQTITALSRLNALRA